MTLNDFERRNGRYFSTEFGSFRGALRKMVEDIPKLSATGMEPMACSFYRYITSGDMM